MLTLIGGKDAPAMKVAGHKRRITCTLEVVNIQFSQIMSFLKQNEEGTPVSALCWECGFSQATFYEWRAKYGGMDASMMKRLEELEDENRRLK